MYISPQIGNESKVLEEKGLWGSPALWKDENGRPWVYVTLWGEATKAILKSAMANGDAPHGSIEAFKVESDKGGSPCLKLAWISADVDVPDAPALANGVLFVVATGENSRQVKELKTNFKSEQEWKRNLLTTEERARAHIPPN